MRYSDLYLSVLTPEVSHQCGETSAEGLGSERKTKTSQGETRAGARLCCSELTAAGNLVFSPGQGLRARPTGVRGSGCHGGAHLVRESSGGVVQRGWRR